MTSDERWHSIDGRLQLRRPRFSADVDVRAPSLGLHNVRVDDQPFEDFALLGVELPSRACSNDVDHFVRGDDVIATYPETAEWPLRAQIYWRSGAIEPVGTIAAIELIASMQTSLLDACPRLNAQSRLPGCETLRLTDLGKGTFTNVTLPADHVWPHAGQTEQARCFLFRLTGTTLSYAEMVAPLGADQTQLDASRGKGANGPARLVHQLFTERLEKGVILRARVLGLLMERDGDLERAARQYAAFLSQAPPLTA
jgi:hypothetical protein